MNDVEELKQFVVVHARAQNIAPEHYTAVLNRITDDEPGSPDSWAAQWSAAAERFAQQGNQLDACRNFNMARFPFVDGPDRERALRRCIEAFDIWRTDTPIEPVEVEVPDAGRIRCWATGLSTSERKPLLLVMGGIVTIKEQWAPVLLQAARLGMAGVVAELPGVGENSLPYDDKSHRMITAILDAVADRADTARTYAIALSFSGHLTLRAAAEDSRIRGIVTSGAPISDFFTDTVWGQMLPKVTVDTLAHLTGGADLSGWGLTAAELSEVDIPVGYIVSGRDEIIPPGDVAFLRRHARDVRTVEYPDVHGSPAHVDESRLWTVRSVLAMRGGNLPQRAVLSALLAVLRLRRAIRR